MQYLGDIPRNQTIDFFWSTNAADGSSITRATNGTIYVYKANSTTETTTGVTDDEDFDSITGIHHVRIVTTDAFYAAANDYAVILKAATIDGKTVNAVLAHFSIENRFAHPNVTAAAVFDLSMTGHTLSGSFGEAVANAGAAADPWGTALPGSYAAGKAGYILGTYLDQKVSTSNQSPGAGAIAFTYTLTSTLDNSPVPDAAVWATADSGGTMILASGRTDNSGEVTFYLDPGTVYIWRAKRGWTFANPDTETVS